MCVYDVYVYIYIYIYVHVHMCVYIYIYTDISLCMYVYIYIYTHTHAPLRVGQRLGGEREGVAVLLAYVMYKHMCHITCV